MHAALLMQLVERLAPRARSFAELSARCMGAWPGATAQALEDLGRTGRLARSDGLRMMRSARKPGVQGAPRQDARLPLPHPLDHDWRFTSSSADVLLASAAALSPLGRRLLLVCAPTVAFRAALLTPRWTVTLLARGADPVTAAVSRELGDSIEVVDFERGAEGIEADVAIVDPPWYDDIALPLTAFAVAGLRQEGVLLSCYPDELTGAGRAASLSPTAIRQTGLAVAVVPGFSARVRYETPFFEVNALRALDLAGHHPRWRTGRVFAAHKEGRRPFPGGVPLGVWSEIAPADIARLATRDCDPTRRADSLVVSSVSRAHPARSSATWWTSGNRAPHAGRPGGPPHSPGLSYNLLAKEMDEAASRLEWIGTLRPRVSSGLEAIGNAARLPRIYIADRPG